MVEDVTLTSLVQLARMRDSARSGPWLVEDYLFYIELWCRDRLIAIAYLDHTHPWQPAESVWVNPGDQAEVNVIGRLIPLTPEELQGAETFERLALEGRLSPRKPIGIHERIERGERYEWMRTSPIYGRPWALLYARYSPVINTMIQAIDEFAVAHGLPAPETLEDFVAIHALAHTKNNSAQVSEAADNSTDEKEALGEQGDDVHVLPR